MHKENTLTFMDRIVIEKDELDEKIGKLKKVLDENRLPEHAIDIHKTQLSVMIEYSNILAKKLK